MVVPSNLPGVEPELEKAVNIYISFMEEIKVRVGAIHNIVALIRAAPETGNERFLQAEFAFLQFRYVCELITLSALVAHSPYGLSQDLMEGWNARYSLRDLAKINASCFPRAVTLTRKPDGGLHIEFIDGTLTRRGLVRHYMKCGRILHRGVIKHALEGTARIYDIHALDRWAHRVEQLLADHVMLIPDHGLALILSLTGGPNGSARCAISKVMPSLEPSELEGSLPEIEQSPPE